MDLSSGPWKVAIGHDQAMENWMIATLGASIDHGDQTIYVTTDRVHASMAQSWPFQDAEFIVRCRNYAMDHGDPLARIAELEKSAERYRKLCEKDVTIEDLKKGVAAALRWFPKEILSDVIATELPTQNFNGEYLNDLADIRKAYSLMESV